MPRRRKADTVAELSNDSATATIEPESTDSYQQTEMADTELLEAPETTEAPEGEKQVVKGERLSGDALMAKIHELDSETITEDEMIRACGYYSDTFVDGELLASRLASNAFWAAFTAASTGIKFAKKTRAGGVGRPKQPYVKVAKGTCKISVGGHFAEQAGFVEHQKVKVTAEAGIITITPYEGPESEADEDEDF